jgi:hypothetical protein
MDISYLERSYAFDTFLAHFSPWKKGGDHNFIQVQFNETHLKRLKKGDRK